MWAVLYGKARTMVEASEAKRTLAGYPSGAACVHFNGVGGTAVSTKSAGYAGVCSVEWRRGPVALIHDFMNSVCNERRKAADALGAPLVCYRACHPFHYGYGRLRYA